MKIMRKSLCITLVASLLMSIFVFAPGVFAATDGQAKSSKAPSATTQEDSETFTISTAQVAGGTVQVNKNTAAKGDAVTYAVTPDTGYKIASIRVGDEGIPITTPYTTSTDDFEVTGDTAITAVFVKLSAFKITTSATTGGSITSSKNVTENGSMTIKTTPKSGYYLSDLQVDGKSKGAKSTYTLKNVVDTHKVKATFKKQVRIMLDAGHYGNYNQSPVYKSYYESNMTWQLHLYLKEELQKYDGFYVGTTRPAKANDLSVYYRGTASDGYDLFLSLHSNSSSNTSVDTPLVIHQKYNGVSKTLVKALGSTMETTMGTKDKYTYWSRTNSDGKTEYYGVLRGASAVGTPGLILEHSFHSNLKMTKWLSSNSNLRKMAVAEAKTLANYYDLELKDGETVEPEDPEEPADPEPEEPEIVSTTKKVKVVISDLNIRKSYTSSSKSMGYCKKNTVYQLKAMLKDGTWGQLKTNGYWIYLKGGYTTTDLTEESSKTVASTDKVKVTVSSLTMRKSYSTSSTKMGTCKKNTVYQLKAKTKDGLWGQLKTNGYWIYLKGYTTKVTSTSSSTSKVVASTEKVKVTVSSLTMRKSYSSSSTKMGTCKKNTVYQLKAKTKDGLWGQLKTNGYWIYLKGYTKKA